MIPAIIAAAVAAKMAGDYAGGQKAKDAINRGEAGYASKAQQGINTLEQGKQGATAAYNPYTTAGQYGVGGYTDATKNYLANVGTGPDASQYQSSPGQVSQYLDPSAAYTSDQASKATQASAMAKGGMGGGLAKALSNNANKMAMTNYNNAYQQMLGTNQQNYGLANQSFQNLFNTQNQNMANYGNLANMGLQATNANQNLLGQYNTGIGNIYGNWGTNIQSNANNKAGVGNAQATGMGNSFLSGISSMYGAGAGQGGTK